jgi:drug/metabolite transporter (DMT)-like permease
MHAFHYAGAGDSASSWTDLVGSRAYGLGWICRSGILLFYSTNFDFCWISRAVAIISTVLPIITFLAGLERVGPTNASILSTIEPITTVILAMLVLEEAITPLRIAGGMMILFTVIVLARNELP